MKKITKKRIEELRKVAAVGMDFDDICCAMSNIPCWDCPVKKEIPEGLYCQSCYDVLNAWCEDRLRPDHFGPEFLGGDNEHGT